MNTTIIRQSEVNVLLQNKLSEEDIRTSSETVSRSAAKNQILLDIIVHRNLPDTGVYDFGKFVVPEGSVTADIMFVLDPPSALEGSAHTSMFGADGRLMTVILDKLGLRRDSVYITHISKYFIKSEDQTEASYDCGARFLLPEIDLVKPKMIVTLGDTAMKVVRGLLMSSEEEVELSSVRGKVFKGSLLNQEMFVVHATNPRDVLEKQGSMYTKYKTDLWGDVSGAYSYMTESK